MSKFLYFLFLISSIQFCFAQQDIDNPKTKWEFKTQGPIRGSSVILEGNVYFGSSDGFLYAVDKQNGRLKWKYQTNGAIVSTPTISQSILYITNRNNVLYALDAYSGKLVWEFKMQPDLRVDENIPPGWHYFMASPVVINNNILIGSGDGNLYYLDAKKGKLKWKFKTNGEIRATPLVHEKTIYQPSNDGYVYVINLDTGKMLFNIETKGAIYDPVKFSFNRKFIYTQPLIKNDVLFYGSNDGNVYAYSLKEKQIKWKFSYGTTWAKAISISDGNIYAGWSTNNLINAIDIHTGKEKWQFNSGGVNYNNPLVLDSGIYFGSASGNIYRLHKSTGEKIWEYTIGSEVFSPLVYNINTLFFGSDNGSFYAIEQGIKPFKAVYQPLSIEDRTKFLIVDNKVTPYLVEKGFNRLDKIGLYNYITNRIKDKKPSVIVFSLPVIPKNIIGIEPEKGMLRQYLESGGKIVWLSNAPNFYELNEKGEFKRDPTSGSKLLGVNYIQSKDSGHFYTKATQEGLNWGLPNWFRTTGGLVPSNEVIPLGIDEHGRASIWLKKFNPRPGSGFISCRTWSWNVGIKQTDLEIIHQLAIHELE